jgi:CRP-like cAMP-binding protein
MEKQQFLRSIPIFAQLSEDQRALLAVNMALQTFERGETIFHQGSIGSTLYIVVSGKVRIYTISETGQELAVTIFRAGDFFGELALLDHQPRSASAETMTRTSVLMLQKMAFLNTITVCPPIAVALLEALAARLRQSNTYVEHLASLSAPQRVVRQLVGLARHGDAESIDPQINLRLTQDELASLSGTTRETVNRVLSHLRDQGILLVERSRVRVLSLARLEQVLAAGR